VQADETELTRPWVDWTARQIPDPVWRLRYLRSVLPEPSDRRRWKSRKTIALLTLVAIGAIGTPLSLRRLGAASTRISVPPPALPPAPPPARVLAPSPVATAPADVWPVEKTGQLETFSNGLRIENQFAVSHRPRAFVAYTYDGGGERRSEPVGIVFHTTESLQAPFESSHNNVLKRVGESLIEYVRRRQCYHFLIDRFGRVFRIVNETDAADHAGHSTWADDGHYYVNLNDSFIGISFEAQTGAGETATSVGDAQIRSAGMLTEMLRSRYHIPAGNCVTHAQVSVNPSNMQIAYHVDWASSFPFEKLGLPDNYATPSPAVALFGFGFDSGFEHRAGARLAGSAISGQRALADAAGRAHVSLAEYRKSMHRRFAELSRSPEAPIRRAEQSKDRPEPPALPAPSKPTPQPVLRARARVRK